MEAPRHRTTRDLKLGNRMRLLRALYFDGPLTRRDLAPATDLSTATISNVTAGLLADGVLREAGKVESDGGRPQILLEVDPGHARVVGVDVGETQVRVELLDLKLAERARARYALAPGRHDPATVIEHIVAGVKEVLAEADGAPVLGVGVGMPGIVEYGPEGVIHAKAFGWDAVPLGRMLMERLDPLPVHIENGAMTMGQAELWFGAGRGADNAVIALIGSGVGSCVVAGGALYRGAGSSAGEWGHTTMAVAGRPCRCGCRGCLEAYVGAEGILDRYLAAAGVVELTGEGEEADLERLLDSAAHYSASLNSASHDSAASGDPRGAAAAAVVDETVEYLGAGLADLLNLFNPELIVIGGWAGLMLAHRRLADIQAAAGSYSLGQPFATARIVPGLLGPDAVAKGAATLVIERFLSG
ncbi:ROK family transcriptional regulator [Glycomyces sp. A-F 0318]|uniref:ROK family transcriptional regulator n=1 Tax=Glycomyces amatae TaxID=2881355 RepID=UPI001E5CC9D3|nr:ROK family transcriptional regulator [Glycomyces amatae]MCD0442998.1 ROK family transcriptional regulator [Glycomyces amatae]